jgi:hypothetical protein
VPSPIDGLLYSNAHNGKSTLALYERAHAEIHSAAELTPTATQRPWSPLDVQPQSHAISPCRQRPARSGELARTGKFEAFKPANVEIHLTSRFNGSRDGKNINLPWVAQRLKPWVVKSKDALAMIRSIHANNRMAGQAKAPCCSVRVKCSRLWLVLAMRVSV